MSKAIRFRNRNNEPIYVCPYFPVGSIYLSVNNTNPGSVFGGTWVQIKDRFLLGAGSTYTAGKTGGSATHTLTINEIKYPLVKEGVYESFKIYVISIYAGKKRDGFF